MENEKLVRMRAVQDAIDNLDWVDGGGGKIYVRQTELVDAIDSIPAVDAVEVCRCGQCQFTETDCVDAIYCQRWDRWEMEPDGYCAWGQRREDGDAT